MITEITKEQEASIPAFIDKAIHSVNTPVDFNKSREYIWEIFGKTDKKGNPKIIIECSSIKNSIDMINYILKITNLTLSNSLSNYLESSLRDSLNNSLSNSLDSSLHDSLRGSLSNSLSNSLDSSLRDSLRGSLYDSLYNSLNSSLRVSLRVSLNSSLHVSLHGSLRNSLNNSLNNSLSNSLSNSLDSSLRDSLDSSPRDSPHGSLRGSLDSSLHSSIYTSLENSLNNSLNLKKINYTHFSLVWWKVWTNYYRFTQSIGVKYDEEKLKKLEDITTNIPMFIALGENVFLVIDMPTEILWENGRLHSDQKPALKWKDDDMFFLDGVKFEKSVWENILSKTMTFKEIMAIEISDQRTIALKYNPEAIIKEHAVLVDKDNRNNELYMIENQPINKDLGFDKIWFLKMLCPTGRTFIEGVPNEEAEKNPKAGAMQALLCGLTYSEYLNMTFES